MDLPTPPTPDQLTSSGIQMSEPTPDLSAMSDEDLQAVAGGDHPDMSHLSDEELMKLAKDDHPDMSHLSDEELRKLAGPDKEQPKATVKDIMSAFTGPVNELITAPVRGGAWLMNKALTATGVQPVDNPEPMASMKQALYPDVPNTPGTRIAGAAGRMIPDTALMMGTMGAAAPEIMAARGTNAVSRPILGGLQDAIKSYAARPNLAAKDLLISGPAAGAGSEIAKEKTEGTPYQGLAELAGGVGGAGLMEAPATIAAPYYKYLSPTVWGARGANLVKNIVVNNTPDALIQGEGVLPTMVRNMKATQQEKLNKNALPMAAKTFQSLGTPETAEAFQKAEDLRKQMPGFDPTLAESTGLPSLIATQKSREASSSGNILDKFVNRKQESEAAINQYARRMTPDSEPMVDVYHVTPDSENVSSIKSKGLNPELGESLEGREHPRSFITTEPEQANAIAGHLRDAGGDPATMHFRIPQSEYNKLNPELDKEMPAESSYAIDNLAPSQVNKWLTSVHSGDAPPKIVSSGSVEDAVARRVASAQKPVDAELAKTQGAREDLADTLPQAKAYDTGQYLRKQLETMRGEKQDEMSQLADDMGLNDAKRLFVSRDGLQKAAQSALPSRFAANTSPTLRTIGKLDEGEKLSFNDAKYFMEQLGQEARLAAKQGNGQDAAIISKARGNIDDYLKNEWAPALQIGDKYAAFRDRYLNDYVNRFEKGGARDVKALGPDSEYRTDNEDVAGTFFKPGDVTAAKDFHRTFGDDSKAQEALQAHIMDQVRSVAVKDGTLDPKALDKWMTANKDNLAEFPAMQSRLQNMQATARDLAERQATLESRKQTIQDSNLTKMLQDKNVTMDGLLQDKNALGRVIGGATPEEKQSMARQLYEHIGQGAKDDPAAMKKMLDDHADVLPKLLSPEHIDALHNIQQAWEMNARTPTPTGRGTQSNILDNFKQQVGSSPQQLLSRFFAVQSGRTGWKYTAGDLLARAGLMFNTRQADAMLDRAMYDPEMAKQLAEFVKPGTAPKPEQLKRFKAYLFQTGITAASDQTGENNGH